MLEAWKIRPTLAEKQLLQAARSLMGLPSLPSIGVAEDDILACQFRLIWTEEAVLTMRSLPC